MENTYRKQKYMIKKAENLARKYHKGQIDKGGNDYFLHLQYVSEHVRGYEEKIVGYLHDIIEDTDYPEETLRSEFGDDVADAILSITKKKGESYMAFILRVKQNEIAKHVKIADLIHNSTLGRIENPSQEDYERVGKYRKALLMLGYEDYNKAERYQCRCCGNYTLDEPADGSFEICPVCGWEDDNVQSDNIHFRGGANINSLYVSRNNYIKTGAADRGAGFYYRKPFPFEIKG